MVEVVVGSVVVVVDLVVLVVEVDVVGWVVFTVVGRVVRSLACVVGDTC